MQIQTIIDDHQFRELIREAKANLHNLRPAMALVGKVICESIDDTFAAEGRPNSWAALADSTKAAKNPDWQILEGETKRLREGIHIETIGHNFVDVAPDDLPYARIQHLGGHFSIISTRREVKIPARPYMVLQSSDADRIAEVIADYIMENL